MSAEPEFAPEIPLLRFEPLEVFAAFEEPGADPLVHDTDGGAANAVGSTAVVYGTGGAGKTTALVDMIFAWAAGRSWMGLLAPTRPLRIVVIENEGPRPMFRDKLRRKLASWDGAIDGRVELLTEPWPGSRSATSSRRASSLTR